MNILIICNWGKNRSSYLALYLQQKGYEVKFGGVYYEGYNQITQNTVDWSKAIIFIQPQIKKDFLKRLRINNQKIITLNIEDRMSVLAPDKNELTEKEWNRIQQKYVYPELERQIEKHLPITK
jgi:predicted protein tyrosine phosphatase